MNAELVLLLSPKSKTAAMQRACARSDHWKYRLARARRAKKNIGRHQVGLFDEGAAPARLGASRRLGRGAAAVVARGVTLTRPLRGAWTLRRTRPRTVAAIITSRHEAAARTPRRETRFGHARFEAGNGLPFHLIAGATLDTRELAPIVGADQRHRRARGAAAAGAADAVDV